MHFKARVLLAMVSIWVAMNCLCSPARAQKPIVLGAPLAMSFLYGWDADKAFKLAVEEINAAGGVKVGNEKRPFALEVIDTRDLEPGVPVSEALLAVEKLILEKKADFIVGGPVRSEAALAAMSTLVKHKKISILTTGALTPKYSAIIASNPEKYKYLFRISGEAKWMVLGEMVPCLEGIGKQYGLNRLMIMIQDVAHARMGGAILKKVMSKKGWKVSRRSYCLPHRNHRLFYGAAGGKETEGPGDRYLDGYAGILYPSEAMVRPESSGTTFRNNPFGRGTAWILESY